MNSTQRHNAGISQEDQCAPVLRGFGLVQNGGLLGGLKL